jgi:PEP-CTERM motif
MFKGTALVLSFAAAVFISTLDRAQAGTVLIVNGSSTTSEPGTTTSITTQLTNLENAVGNTVTVVDTPPASLAGFGQVWDLRFSNSSPLTAAVQTEYLAYLQGGGGMFVMGENAGFGTRNSSVINFIAAAGGGNLTFTVAGDSQTVIPPFTGPNAVTSIQYLAAGGVTTSGTGQFITSNMNGGAGVAFGVGTLANAPLGALTAIFDVNFLQTDANAESQALAKNLVGFVQNEVTPGVPEPSTWAMMLLGFAGLGFAFRHSRRKVSIA